MLTCFDFFVCYLDFRDILRISRKGNLARYTQFKIFGNFSTEFSLSFNFFPASIARIPSVLIRFSKLQQFPDFLVF